MKVLTMTTYIRPDGEELVRFDYPVPAMFLVSDKMVELRVFVVTELTIWAIVRVAFWQTGKLWKWRLLRIAHKFGFLVGQHYEYMDRMRWRLRWWRPKPCDCAPKR